MKFLFLDTEAGGLDYKKHPLLSASFYVTDERVQILDKLELFIQHEEYLVTPGALAVNKIDLVKHHEKAKPREWCEEELKKFLKKHTEIVLKEGGFVFRMDDPNRKTYEKPVINSNKLIPVGQNISFDLKNIKENLFPNWDKYVSYRFLDTQTIANFLMMEGVIDPPDGKISLGALVKYFGIKFDENTAHTASGDVERTIQVYSHLRNSLITYNWS